MSKREWPSSELSKIASKDDLKISPLRDDGITYGTPTWIWNVAVDGNLFVRAYHGQKSSWYKAALEQKSGRIHAAGMIREVSFEPVPVSAKIHTDINQAYEIKYAGHPFLKSMIGEKATGATIKIVPV